ncbi:uncharacterized protein N7498_003156 [Penicillium cinerascens]|uniref:Myb-like domain-containing protein n=1 Tax=Penicillium cinerascens TaxID=70096 RepID=A0A9W9N1G4_9EURO|nr:uncharacterized protein N7498_003156 [Penicillium cinerascens]KAJ5211510.1 hypothetical protein N7498_003156 [Penicillium cinerascens]
MVSWDHTADKRLLAAIYTACGGTFDWEAAADEFGDGCSAEGIRQHIRALRKKGGPGFGTSKSNDQTKVTPSPKAPATPSSGVSKAKRAGTRATPTKGKKELVKIETEDKKKSVKNETEGSPSTSEEV